MALPYTYPWHYDSDDAAELTLSSGDVLDGLTAWELEFHLTLDDVSAPHYLTGKFPANPSGALQIIPYNNEIIKDGKVFTGVPQLTVGKRLRIIFRWDSNSGNEFTAKVDPGDGIFVDLLETHVTTSNPVTLNHLYIFGSDAKHSRCIVRDGPDGTVIHDFNPNRVKLNSGGYGDRGHADAVDNADDILFDEVGGLTGTAQNTGLNPFIIQSDIISVNDGIPVAIGATSIPLVLSSNMNVTAIEIDDTVNAYSADFVDDGTTTYTLDVPLTSDDSMVTLGTHEIRVVTDSGTYTNTIEIAAPAGHTEVLLGGFVETNETSYSFGQAWLPQTDDYYFYLPTTDFTITDSNVFQPSGDAPWEHTVWHLSASGLRKTTVSSGYGVVTGTVPVADAGTDQTNIAAGATVTLDGSGSSDAEGAVTYSWTQTAGDTITLSDATAASPTFTAPTTNTDQTLTFQLTVTDTDGNTASATVNIGVLAEVVNNAPTANAGTDQANIAANATVTLDGSGSSDSDGTIVSYAWSQTAGDTVTLSDANVAQPTFIAPTTNADQTLTFQLTVTDDDGATATATVNITVLAEVAGNTKPVAAITIDAGAFEAGATVNISASTSSDADGDALTYAWTVDSGVTIADATAQSTTLTLPSPQTDTEFTLNLVVNDGTIDSDMVSVTRTVNAAVATPLTVSDLDTLSYKLVISGDLDVIAGYQNRAIVKVQILNPERANASVPTYIDNVTGLTYIDFNHINIDKIEIKISDASVINNTEALIDGSYSIRLNTDATYELETRLGDLPDVDAGVDNSQLKLVMYVSGDTRGLIMSSAANPLITDAITATIEGNLLRTSTVTELHQLSVNVIHTPVNLDGKVQLPSTYNNAVYTLATLQGTIIKELTLNDGIVADNDNKKFIITLPANAITKDTKGSLQHQFVLYNAANQKLPPVFKERVKVIEVLSSQAVPVE